MLVYFSKLKSLLYIMESSRVTSVELDNDLYLKDVRSSSTAVSNTMGCLPELNVVMIKVFSIFTKTDAIG